MADRQADAESDGDLAKTFGRIQYAEDVEHAPSRSRTYAWRNSEDSMSIRTLSRQRTVDPSLVLPVLYRTLSFNIEESRSRELRARDEPAKSKETGADFANADWHTISIDEVLRRLSASLQQGLSGDQAARKLKEHGPNVPTPPPTRWVVKTLTHLFGGFGSILFVAAVLVFISWKPLGQPPALANLALAIVLVVVFAVQAGFSWYQDWSSGRVMASITTMLPAQCLVLREGSQKHIAGTDIVPGDVLCIKMGDKLPADVRFAEVSTDARFDRSILTGETVPMHGTVDSTDDNFLETACIGMAGTHCVSGSALGIVIATGDRTVFGRIAKLTSTPKKGLTTLQKEIFRFIAIIVSLMTVMIITVIVVWAVWLRKSHPGWISVPNLIVVCVSVAVSFVPEGLPIAVTASLTITANIMKQNKVLCKSLKTVETLGAVSVICSDKTGTLTKNQMTVTDCLVAKEQRSSTAALNSLDTDSGLRQLAVLSGICNSAEFDAATAQLPLTERKINGDATDTAVLRFAESLNSVADVRRSWKVVFRVAFNSKNKFMIHVIQPSGNPNDHSAEAEKLDPEAMTLTIKGAPDILITRCSHFMDRDGLVQPLEDEARRTIEEIKDHWSAQGKRVILLARKDLPVHTANMSLQSRDFEQEIMDQATTGLTLVGLVGIVDPPRDEIPDVVRTLRAAGIKVHMVTGDFKLTAQAIAAECGIITGPPESIHDASALSQNASSEALKTTEVQSPGSHTTRSIVLSGADMIDLDDGQWDVLCEYDEIVFARTTPEQKLKIVKEFQARDEVVAMTGDGVNDAPSLKAADVGIAMGSGSDIAIEAADMVLLDSFAAVVEAVKYGRVVFDNLKKTICYLLPAGTFSEFWPVFTNVVFGMPQILSSFLMIIICCFTDCAAATAIAYEKPEADVLLRRPRNMKKDRLVDWKLFLQAYGFLGVLEALSSFAMSYWYAQRRGVPFSNLWFGFGVPPAGLSEDEYNAVLNQASSIYFLNLVIMQWFNLLAVRTRRLSLFQHSPLRNPYLAPAVIFSFVVAVVFLYIPKLQSVLGTASVPVEHYFLPMAFGLGLLLLDEGRKWCVRRWPSGLLARMAW